MQSRCNMVPGMSLPMPMEPRDPKDLRVSHEDRERVAEDLRVAAGDGRLSLEELDQRLDAAFGARTYADLVPLLADLPGSGGDTLAALGRAAVAAPVPPPKDVVRVKRSGGVLRYEGAWLVPKRLELEAHGGAGLIDFTRAAVSVPVTEIDVRMRGGSLRIIVPPGYAVDANEVSMRGGAVRDRTLSDDPDHGRPVVHRIILTGSMSGGSIVIEPPKPPKAPRKPGWLRRLFGS
jgi:hypothetical protein